MASRRQGGQAAVQCPTRRDALGHKQAVQARFWLVQPPLRVDVGWHSQSACEGAGAVDDEMANWWGAARVGWGWSSPPLPCATPKGPCQPS